MPQRFSISITILKINTSTHLGRVTSDWKFQPIVGSSSSFQDCHDANWVTLDPNWLGWWEPDGKPGPKTQLKRVSVSSATLNPVGPCNEPCFVVSGNPLSTHFKGWRWACYFNPFTPSQASVPNLTSSFFTSSSNKVLARLLLCIPNACECQMTGLASGGARPEAYQSASPAPANWIAGLETEAQWQLGDCPGKH